MRRYYCFCGCRRGWIDLPYLVSCGLQFVIELLKTELPESVLIPALRHHNASGGTDVSAPRGSPGPEWVQVDILR